MIPALIPEKAAAVIELLGQLLPLYWGDMPMPSFLPAQIEQETCIHLKHPTCFSERAELRTPREYGFGFGQLTITSRFNAFEEVKRLHRDLAAWSFEDRYNPRKQLAALILKDRQHYRGCARLMADQVESLACTAAQYNGGAGGFLLDQRLCSNTAGCDPTRWFDHIEHTSTKARTVATGYGRSFFEINRDYVQQVVKTRRAKYVPVMERQA